MELTPFTFPATGEPVRTILIDGDPWFVATDVARILGYSDPNDAVTRHVDAEDTSSEKIDTASDVHVPVLRRITTINESGLYALVFGSRLPSAKAFKRWVTAEVLPTIRKTGSYNAPAVQPAPRELSRLELIELARDAELGRLEAETRIAELAPAAASWEALASANGDYSVADAAKILTRDGIKTGERRLFTDLWRLGWLFRAGDGRWRVKQTAIEAGRLSELPSSHYHPRTGVLVLDPPQVRVTVKGVHDLRRALGAKALEAAR